MQFALIATSLVSLLSAAPLLDGLFGGAPGFGYGGPAAGPYNGFAGAYRPRPLASVNLRDLSVGSPKQKDTQINIDEGMYNSQGYNPFAPAPWGTGPPPGLFPGQAPLPQ